MDDRRWRLVGAVALTAAVGAGLSFGMLGGAEPLPSESPAVTPVGTVAEPPPADEIVVHVAGAVRRPGLVELPPGSRVADAVAAAGGLTEDAVDTAVNLAAPLTDGSQVVVPSVTDPVPAESTGDGLVHVNVASAQDLERLPGVGPVLAERIVAFRDSNGPFGTVEDLLDVPGIGEAKLAAMRDALAVP